MKLVKPLLICIALILLAVTSGYSKESNGEESIDVTPLEKAAVQGDADAQCYLGLLYYLGQGVEQDYAKAKEWLEKATAQGNANAQCLLGILYFQGHGVKQDYAKAKELVEKAALHGSAEAQHLLGLLYEEGLGVRKNSSTAKEWYGKACNNGFQEGCNEYKRLNNRR